MSNIRIYTVYLYVFNVHIYLNISPPEELTLLNLFVIKGGDYRRCIYGCKWTPGSNSRSCGTNSYHGARSTSSEWFV